MTKHKEVLDPPAGLYNEPSSTDFTDKLETYLMIFIAGIPNAEKLTIEELLNILRVNKHGR
jgi:hypothetical protein